MSTTVLNIIGREFMESVLPGFLVGFRFNRLKKILSLAFRRTRNLQLFCFYYFFLLELLLLFYLIFRVLIVGWWLVGELVLELKFNWVLVSIWYFFIWTLIFLYQNLVITKMFWGLIFVYFAFNYDLTSIWIKRRNFDHLPVCVCVCYYIKNIYI